MKGYQVFIVFIFLLIGYSYYQEYTHIIEIKANLEDTLIIKNILNTTEKDINKYINNINVIYSKYNLRSMCDSITAMGCFDPNTKNIYIISQENYKKTCNDFEYTIYHEIGHAVGNNIGNDTEEYADNFAHKYIVNKCETPEYLNLEEELQEKNDLVNKSEEILSKWDSYEKIPNEYIKEYYTNLRFNEQSITDYNYVVNKINIYIGYEEMEKSKYTTMCDSSKYYNLLNGAVSKYNKLKVWDRYGEYIPYDEYDLYVIDYNNYNEVIDKFENECIEKQEKIEYVYDNRTKLYVSTSYLKNENIYYDVVYHPTNIVINK